MEPQPWADDDQGQGVTRNGFENETRTEGEWNMHTHTLNDNCLVFGVFVSNCINVANF